MNMYWMPGEIKICFRMRGLFSGRFYRLNLVPFHLRYDRYGSVQGWNTSTIN